MSGEVKSTLGLVQARAAMPAPVGRPLSVLVAEDDPVNQCLVAQILTQRGHASAVVANGLDAVRCYQAQEFDAVLMDGQMPEMDGYAASREIRRLEQVTRRRVAIIAVTANAGADQRERCRKAGMDDYVPKPIDPDLLLDCLESAVCRVRRSLHPISAPALATALADAGCADSADTMIFNHVRALERVWGKRRQLQRLTDMLRRELPDVLDAISLAALNNDMEKLGVLAHRLRGGAVTVGGESLAAVAHALEQAAGEQLHAAVPLLVAQLYAASAQLSAALDGLLAEAATPAS